MVVPSPYGLTGDAFVRSLIADGYLGDAARAARPGPQRRPRRPEDPDGLAADDQVLGLQHADPGHPVRDRPALGSRRPTGSSPTRRR